MRTVYPCLLLLFFLFLCLSVNAQKKLNDSVLKITYIQSFQNYPSPKYDFTEYLIVDGNKSYYFNYTKEPDKKGKIIVPTFVFKNRDSNLLYFGGIMYPQYPMGSFWSDTLEAMKWQIVKEYKTFKNILCQKATTFFRGRFFTAYFATSIPIPDGPMKFCGLPGLIMNIKDSIGIFEFGVDKIERILHLYEFTLGPVYGDYAVFKKLNKAYELKLDEKRKARKSTDPNCLDCGDGAEVKALFLEEIFD